MADPWRFMRTHTALLILLALFAAWSVLLLTVSPERIVEIVGIKNTYAVVFLLAVISGVSVLTSTPFYLSILSFADGGATPYLLGIMGGLGLFISDTIFYFLVRLGRIALAKRWNPALKALSRWKRRTPPWLVAIGVTVYASLPLPSDALMGALALSDYPFKRFAPFLLVGTITGVTLIALLGREGILS